jgi:hypothetical protein
MINRFVEALFNLFSKFWSETGMIRRSGSNKRTSMEAIWR